MKTGLRVLLAGAFATLLLSGCAVHHPTGSNPADNHWQGRLSVRVEADPVQSVSAGFDLLGTAEAGELTLLTPLGGAAAVMTWTPQSATLASQGEVKRFGNLQTMVRQAVGADLPVAAIFAWLAGKPAEEAGWSADLSGHPQRITARRLSPLPAAELRLILNLP